MMTRGRTEFPTLGFSPGFRSLATRNPREFKLPGLGEVPFVEQFVEHCGITGVCGDAVGAPRAGILGPLLDMLPRSVVDTIGPANVENVLKVGLLGAAGLAVWWAMSPSNSGGGRRGKLARFGL